ncbi:MAG: hypothetical protein QNJ31_02745 [Candidatus Caenarcaniphilales bacterium]|nr:hypothetical protein [Candidatus Caenarcaniphilales bacterium]
MFLYSCQSVNVTENVKSNSLDFSVSEEVEDSNISRSSNIKERKLSPDRRVEIVWYFLDSDSQSYRLTAIDREQRKVIFSREFNLQSNKKKKNTKLISIVKVLNDCVLLKEESENYKNYFLLKPDTGETWTVECNDFRDGEYEISYFAQDGYRCEGLLKKSREFTTSGTIKFPSFLKLSSDLQAPNRELQVVEKENLKVELSPFKSSKMQTLMGERALLKYFVDGKLKYQKFFSGKCTGCQWVNQDNWNEAFRIEQLVEDKILLTQILLEVDKKNNKLLNQPIHSSILIIPSKNVLKHLSCNEKDHEIAFVSDIGQSSYKCKYMTESKSYFKTMKLTK